MNFRIWLARAKNFVLDRSIVGDFALVCLMFGGVGCFELEPIVPFDLIEEAFATPTKLLRLLRYLLSA